MDLDLTDSTSPRRGARSLTCARRLDGSVPVDSVGPGWDDLDRLLRAHAGDDAGTVDRDASYPARAGHYRAEFS